MPGIQNPQATFSFPLDESQRAANGEKPQLLCTRAARLTCTTKTFREISIPVSSAKVWWVPSLTPLFRDQAFYAGSQGTDPSFQNKPPSLLSLSAYVCSSKVSWSSSAHSLACQACNKWWSEALGFRVLRGTCKRQVIKISPGLLKLVFKLALKTVSPDLQSLSVKAHRLGYLPLNGNVFLI